MPTADDFLAVEREISGRIREVQNNLSLVALTVGAVDQSVQRAVSELDGIERSVRDGADQVTPRSVAASLHRIATAADGLPGLIAALQSITPGGGGTITIEADPALTTAVQTLVIHAADLARLAVETPTEQGAPVIARAIANISATLNELLLLFSPEAAGGSQLLGIREQLARIGDLLAAGAAAGGEAGAPVDWSPLLDFLSGAFGGSGSSASQALSGLADLLAYALTPGTAEAYHEPPGTPITFQHWMESIRRGVGDVKHSAFLEAIRGLMTEVTAIGADVADTALAPLGVIFQSITTAGVAQMLDEIAGDGPADPAQARARAAKALTRAYTLGQQAHFLAAAVEACHPLHEFGLSNAAAAITDLAGFAPVSNAVIRPYLDAAIGEPQRQEAARRFQPELAGLGWLSDFVRRRTLPLEEYDEWLSYHGIKERHRDLMIETVWRDFSIRDLALALEDASVDREWLLDRMQKVGYSDLDADRVTDALMQRSTRSVRERVRASAVGAYAQGSLSREEFDGILDGLELPPARIAWERQSAELQRRRDMVSDALATYRRQYLNDVIEREDYQLAITALGVDPERIEMIMADADATKAPKIAADEERAVKAAIREVQTELVPRARRLYELGQLSQEAYRQTLLDAGVSDQVATQAVNLDAARLRAVQNQTVANEVARVVNQVLDERRRLLAAQYARGEITETQYRAGLQVSGLADDLVEVIVTSARTRRAATLTEAGRDLLIERFRKGQITADELRDRLLITGLDAATVTITVQRELVRKLPTTPSATPAAVTTPLT